MLHLLQLRYFKMARKSTPRTRRNSFQCSCSSTGAASCGARLCPTAPRACWPTTSSSSPSTTASGLSVAALLHICVQLYMLMHKCVCVCMCAFCVHVYLGVCVCVCVHSLAILSHRISEYGRDSTGRELRHAGPGGRPPMGPEEHRPVRRRQGQGHHRGLLRRRRLRPLPLALASLARWGAERKRKREKKECF